LAGRFELWAARNAGNPQFINQAADGQDNGIWYPNLNVKTMTRSSLAFGLMPF
jgi:hypothetical protein